MSLIQPTEILHYLFILLLSSALYMYIKCWITIRWLLYTFYMRLDSPERPIILSLSSPTPLMSSTNVTENQRVDLQCNSSIRSSPSYVPTIGDITYSWLVDGSSSLPTYFTVSANRLIITRVLKSHTGRHIVCIATQNNKASEPSAGTTLDVSCE